MNVIGEKIRKIREMKDYSQDYMAKKLDMSQNNYSRIEMGKVKIDIGRLLDISKLLEVDPMDIINFDEKYVFQSISHSQNGGETKSGILNNEAIIMDLKEEIAYLREENKRLLGLLEKSK
jgi:transcriptional regulator with XRE-family HTH domain